MSHNNDYESRLIESGKSRVARYQETKEKQKEQFEAESKIYRQALLMAFKAWEIGPPSRENDEKLAKAARTYFEHQYIWVD